MLQHVPSLRASAIVLGLLLAARPAAALLDPQEAEANAALATSAATPVALQRDEPRKLAAQGALALARGETEAAVLYLLRARPGVADCALQAMLASLNSGEPCAGAVWSPLEPAEAADGPPVAARLVGARHGESGQAFFAAVTVAAVQAAAGGGVPEVRSGSDRFLVRAGPVLEGTWFLDDRMLVVARPGTGGADAARAALDRLALARPEQVLGGPALDGAFVERSAPLPARERSAPLPARERSAPLPARESSAPLAARERSAPLAARESSAPLAARESSAPLAARESSAPVAAREPATPAAAAAERPAPGVTSGRSATASARERSSVARKSKAARVEPEQTAPRSLPARVAPAVQAISRHHVDPAGFALDVPLDAVVTSGGDGTLTLRFPGGTLLVRSRAAESARGSRSAIARRKPSAGSGDDDGAGLVPDGARVLSTRETTLDDGLQVELLELESGGDPLTALRRVVRSRGQTIELMALPEGAAATPPDWAMTAARTLSAASR